MNRIFPIGLLWIAWFSLGTVAICMQACVWGDQSDIREIRPDPEFVPFSFAVIGDYGEEGEPARKVSDLVDSWNPDFILTTGDNNYWSGERMTLNQNIGQYYCEYIYNPDAADSLRCAGRSAQERINRFFPSLGNHDFYNPEDHLPYLEYFSLPGNEEYYDFRQGPVHCFALNSGEFGRSSCCESNQSKWLKDRLESSTAPIKLVYFHHAPYSSGRHGNNRHMQWPFEEWGATAVLSGHNHIYQRVIARDSASIPYFVNGLGGKASRYKCADNPMDSTLYTSLCYDENYGAMRIDVREREMEFLFFSVDEPNKARDSYRIFY